MPHESTVPMKRSNSLSMSEDKVSNKKTSSIIITIKQTPEEEKKAKEYFQQHIFDEIYKENLKKSVTDSQPYRWGTIKELIDDELLRNVRKEIMSEISFTKKETDIYKVYQSGDLANLSGMSLEDLSRLPSLYKLRSAIYSQTFRDYISHVTGCGKLSGIKTDMSINTYTKGCHLLTHDDVIGSRRVSFILYLPEPGKTWKPHYGGSLRLFDSVVPNVPKSDVYCKLTPQFNQIAFFTVQPGLSFHDVEEVRVDKQRLSIQGWFHIPQQGEDGYVPGEQERTEAKSTLQQLESKELKEYDFPKVQFNEISELEQKELSITTENNDIELTIKDLNYLSEFMNASMVAPASISRLKRIFTSESVVDIPNFLNDKYSSLLKKQMKTLELNEYPPMPQSQAEVTFPWKLAVPPHKQRYMYIDGNQEQSISNAEEIYTTNQLQAQELPNFKLTSQLTNLLSKLSPIPETELQDNPSLVTVHEVTVKLTDLASFLKSLPFKKWLFNVTGLTAEKDQLLIRRFRPGQDFILATKLEENMGEGLLEGVLEATLNLTPSTGWESGELGGYELCMTNDDDDEEEVKENHDDKESPIVEMNAFNEDEAAIYKSSDKNDSVVYESQACWNKLSLMFRDENVLKFVKYVSFDASGSRWDINCSWKCKDEDEEEEGEGQE